jgi:hypothetical protein
VGRVRSIQDPRTRIGWGVTSSTASPSPLSRSRRYCRLASMASSLHCRSSGSSRRAVRRAGEGPSTGGLPAPRQSSLERAGLHIGLCPRPPGGPGAQLERTIIPDRALGLPCGWNRFLGIGTPSRIGLSLYHTPKRRMLVRTCRKASSYSNGVRSAKYQVNASGFPPLSTANLGVTPCAAVHQGFTFSAMNCTPAAHKGARRIEHARSASEGEL